MSNPWRERRALLEELGVERSCVRPSDVFDDGDVLFDAVVEHGLEASRRQETQRHLSARPPGMDEERERLLPAAKSEIEHMQEGETDPPRRLFLR